MPRVENAGRPALRSLKVSGCVQVTPDDRLRLSRNAGQHRIFAAYLTGAGTWEMENSVSSAAGFKNRNLETIAAPCPHTEPRNEGPAPSPWLRTRTAVCLPSGVRRGDTWAKTGRTRSPPGCPPPHPPQLHSFTGCHFH